MKYKILSACGIYLFASGAEPQLGDGFATESTFGVILDQRKVHLTRLVFDVGRAAHFGQSVTVCVVYEYTAEY